MSILYRYTRDIKLSEDLLQETFVSIFKNLDKFDSAKGSFEAWTARLAVNAALQELRRTKEISMAEIPESSINFESSIHDRMTIAELKKTIDVLPDIHRIILNMYYYDNYSHKEIADILGIKVSSSRSQLTRARIILIERWTKLNTSGIS